MRKAFRYALAFVAGTVLTCSVAYAGTSYVEAQKTSSSIYVNGNKVAAPPMLVYSGSAYVQLYSIQQGLQSAGLDTTWNGSKFNITVPTETTMSKSEFANTINDITQKMDNTITEIANLGGRTDAQAGITVNLDAGTLEALFNQCANLNVSDPTEQKIRNDLSAVLATLFDSAKATSLYIADSVSLYTSQAQDDLSTIKVLSKQANDQINQFNQDLNSFNSVNPIRVTIHSSNLW